MSINSSDYPQAKKRSINLQTNLCRSPSCGAISEVICHHCCEFYCKLCFMCHRKNILDDMQSISEQMAANRRQGTTEVAKFIDKQAKDAHEQAKKLIDDAIDRIVQASKNIYTYIENRRQAKLGRLDECLESFDKDADLLESSLKKQVFLPAQTMLNLRQKYAYNMFDKVTSTLESRPTELQLKHESFFDNYRCYKDFINLREKWPFLQGALTTVYYPMKKDISLDKILTFLEYRHDRVLENYREYLTNNNESKELSLKSAEDLLQEFSFLSKKSTLTDGENFSYIGETGHDIHIESHYSEREPNVKNEIKHEIEIISKADSGHVDDDDDDNETNSSSSQSWEIEDGDDNNDYDVRFTKLSQSMKMLEKQFENDFRPFANNNGSNY